MMALAEFEREQTAERNRDASLARAERGLWNGGYLMGYDLPPEGKKGTLIPNDREVAIVNFAFDTYLETGSILDTTKILNDRGYRTKEYSSRRGKHHEAKIFRWKDRRGCEATRQPHAENDRGCNGGTNPKLPPPSGNRSTWARR